MGESKIRKQQMEQRTQQILHTALKLFCEKGIEDTSVEEIAKAVGVGPATIYRYFETKAELAISAGIAYWQMVAGKYLDSLSQEAYQKLNGIQQIKYIFLDLYKDFSGRILVSKISPGIRYLCPKISYFKGTAGRI